MTTGVVAQINACGAQCQFRLCDPFGLALRRGPNMLIRPPGRLSYGSVCKPGQQIGYVLRTGEPLLALENGDMITISKWRPRKLSPNFLKNTFRVPKNPGRRSSAIATSELQGNQFKFLEDSCIIFPIIKYELLDRRRRRVKRFVKTNGSERDCVSFQTRTAAILVDLTWNSDDDFDVQITEPDGVTLSRFQPETKTGRINGDANSDACGLVDFGRETARYLTTTDGVKKGIYRAEARHNMNCGGGGTKWKLEVSIDGKVVETKEGFSNGGLGDMVGRIRFRYF